LTKKLRGGPEEGLEDLEKKFPATQGERKKIMQHTIEKKNMQLRALKKNSYM
jgi:hypothetical protein